MANEVRIKDHPALVKDTSTGAVLNTDYEALRNYKKQKALARKKEDKVAKLEREVEELKALVHALVKGK